ncbi:MAG: chemotaxis protein CheW [Planctomycetota bacterium]|nr:MAG: chemotaxis protein CheW [Planctomycetota bacterium]
MAETSQIEQVNQALVDKAGKYLTFSLGQEQYGLEILKVREIIGYMDITAVPQTPPHVKGVINLRGQVIPVIDLRAKFGMQMVDTTEQTCVIVVEISQDNRQFSTGIVVDRVEEVLDIDGQDIEATPEFGSSVNTDFILGIGKVGESVKILLDIDKVLGSGDFTSFADNTYTRDEAENKPQVEAKPETETQAETVNEAQTEDNSEPDNNTEADNEAESESTSE